MSQDHTLMRSRYELKYHVTNEVALRIRDFVQQHLEIDEYAAGQPNCSYPVHSLYLDSDDWQIYTRTVNGDKNRFKLRVRYYVDAPKIPVYFEIKRRMKDVILKQRCPVLRGGEQAVYAGQIPAPEFLLNKKAADLFSLQRFVELMVQLNAKPKMHIAYLREAYVSPHVNDVRVTIDRAVQSELCLDGRLKTTLERPALCTKDVVILELKFTERFPNWFRDLVRRFNCMQAGAAKYVESVSVYLGRHRAPPDVMRTMG